MNHLLDSSDIGCRRGDDGDTVGIERELFLLLDNGDVTNAELWQDDGDGVYQGAGTDTQIGTDAAATGGVFLSPSRWPPNPGLAP